MVPVERPPPPPPRTPPAPGRAGAARMPRVMTWTARPFRQGDLGGQVGGGPEPVDPESPAGWKIRPAQGPIADDAGAEQRGGLRVSEARRKGVGVAGVRGGELGVTAVAIPPRERWCDTEVLVPPPAVRAHSAGPRQPGDPDPIAEPERGDGRTEGVDVADHLVSRDDEWVFWRQIAFGQVEICAANTANANPNPNFRRPRLGDGTGHGHQWMAVDGPGLLDRPGFHDPATPGRRTSGGELAVMVRHLPRGRRPISQSAGRRPYGARPPAGGAGPLDSGGDARGEGAMDQVDRDKGVGR